MKRFILGVAAVVLVGIGQAKAIPLSHRYTFDTDASDSVGMNHGTLINGASIVLDAERGGVLHLDGVDDYVSLGWSNIPSGPTDTAVFTIAAWVKIPAGVVAFENQGPIYTEFTSYRDPDGHVGEKNILRLEGLKSGFDRSGRVSFTQTPPGGWRIISDPLVNDGEWHHVAYVQNEPAGFGRKLYIDGVLNVWDDNPEPYTGPAVDSWAIGGLLLPGGQSYLKGHLDDIRFYNDALTANEVAALVPETSSIITWGLIGAIVVGIDWWRRRRTV